MKTASRNTLRRAAEGLALAALLAGCNDGRLAGSEVTNPPQKQTIEGFIRNAGGQPAPGTVVQAIPVNYDPIQDSGAGNAPGWTDTTNAQGAYALTQLEPWAVYNVWAVNAKAGTRLLIRSVLPDTLDTSSRVNGTLQGCGALAILLPDSLPAGPGQAYVYLEGTPLYNDLESIGAENRIAILDSVPAGCTPKLFHKMRGDAGARTLLGQNIRVNPGDTVPVGIYGLWNFSRRIFLNTSASGAGVTGGVGDFPLLVRLDSSNFDFSQARSDGGDLRFARKDGSSLPFEMESWDAAGKQGIAWVKMDSVLGNDSGQFIRMYWGQANADSESQPAAVFSSANYGGVWHFQNFGAGEPPALQDASSAQNTAFAGDYPTGLSLAGTPLGKGMHQNGAQSELYTSKPFTNPGNLTVSLWFRTTTDSGGLLLGFARLQNSADSTEERDRQIWMDDSGIVHFGIATDTAQPVGIIKHVVAGPNAYNDGNWHWVTGMVSPAGMALYVDGKKVAADATGLAGQNYTGYWRMGFSYSLFDWPGTPAAKYFTGDLDEARVSLQPFSDDWVDLTYQSQKPGGNFLRFDPN